MRKFSDIIARAEEVRTKLGLNKSQFSHRIGMKPQTYNNFVGSQGSRPNMELFHGIVREFNVDPMWLLNGSGDPFAGSSPEYFAPQGHEALPGRPLPRRFVRRDVNLAVLKHELDEVLAAYRAGATPQLRSGRHANPEVAQALQVVKHLFWTDPADTAAQVVEMLEAFSQVADEMDWLERRGDLHAAQAQS